MVINVSWRLQYNTNALFAGKSGVKVKTLKIHIIYYLVFQKIHNKGFQKYWIEFLNRI